MKYFNKLMVFFLFLLFNYGVDTFAYTYTIFNETYEDLKVQLYSTFGKLGHPRIIKSAGDRKFSFKFPDSRFGVCLTKIVVSTKDSTGKWEKGKRVFKHTGLCEGEDFDLKFNSFGKLLAVRYYN